jgi:surface protein
MTGMLRDAKLFNQDLNKWDIKKVTNMSEMFYHASNFNIENISKWNHIIYFTSVPFANVLVERLVECKHV